MTFAKPRINDRSTLNLVLLGISTALLLTPSVKAVELNNRQETTQINKFQIQLAQNTCPPNAGGGRLVNYYETENFYVYICRTRRGLFYTGIDKSNGKGTRPLRARTEEGTGYVVKTGDITYIVNGASLSIYRGNNLLQEDAVINSR